MTRCTINGKGCGHGVGHIVPGAVEAHPVVTSSCRNAPVVAQVRDRHVGTALGLAPVPQLRDRLSVSKRPSQRPIRDRRRAGVIDRDGRSKATTPLARNRVTDVAGESGGDLGIDS